MKTKAVKTKGPKQAVPATGRVGPEGGPIVQITVDTGDGIPVLDVEILGSTDRRLEGYGLSHLGGAEPGFVLVGLKGDGTGWIEVMPTPDRRAVVGAAYLLDRVVPGGIKKANEGRLTAAETTRLSNALSTATDEALLLEYEVGRSVPPAWSRIEDWRPPWRRELEQQLGTIEAVVKIPGNAHLASDRYAWEHFRDANIRSDVLVIGVRGKDPSQPLERRPWVPIVELPVPDPEGELPELVHQGPRTLSWTEFRGQDDPRRAGAYGWTYVRLWGLLDPSLDLDPTLSLDEHKRLIAAMTALSTDQLPVRIATSQQGDPPVTLGQVAEALARMLPPDPVLLDRLAQIAFDPTGIPRRDDGDIDHGVREDSAYGRWLDLQVHQIDALLYKAIRAERAAKVAAQEAERVAARRRARSLSESTTDPTTRRAKPQAKGDVVSVITPAGTVVARRDPATELWTIDGTFVIVSRGWKPSTRDVQRALDGWTPEQIEQAAAREERERHEAEPQARRQTRPQGRPVPPPRREEVVVRTPEGEKIAAVHDAARNAWIIALPVPDPQREGDLFERIVSVGWKPSPRDVARAVAGWTPEQIEAEAVREEQARQAPRPQSQAAKQSALERVLRGPGRGSSGRR